MVIRDEKDFELFSSTTQTLLQGLGLDNSWVWYTVNNTSDVSTCYADVAINAVARNATFTFYSRLDDTLAYVPSACESAKHEVLELLLSEISSQLWAETTTTREVQAATEAANVHKVIHTLIKCGCFDTLLQRHANTNS